MEAVVAYCNIPDGGIQSPITSCPRKTYKLALSGPSALFHAANPKHDVAVVQRQLQPYRIPLRKANLPYILLQSHMQ